MKICKFVGGRNHLIAECNVPNFVWGSYEKSQDRISRPVSKPAMTEIQIETPAGS